MLLVYEPWLFPSNIHDLDRGNYAAHKFID